jgi:hypothetical protein
VNGPDAWENELADVLEAAFAEGIHDLDALTARINASRVRPRDGQAWTPERLATTLHELGA